MIYTRVSTDEQKETGFSLQEQLRQLTNYCEQKGYEIVHHYQDDHSAKDFNRPEFQKFLSDLKGKKIKPTIFLVTKIDRFSRDLHLTLEMAAYMKSVGIELYSLSEGTYDFSDPFKYFANVIQSASAQYFNLQLGENTRRGMRQAMREGRYVQKAPKGYTDNKTLKTKEIDPVTGPLIKEAFELLGTGAYSAAEVLQIMRTKGLVCAKQTFLNIMRNPFYAGIIVIPAWKDEAEQKVKATSYQPLISEELFYQVQDIMNGRRKYVNLKTTKNDLLPLRGHLICPTCGHNLTGSGSTGRDKSKKHYYYHCQEKYNCNVRFPANPTNDEFLQLLNSFEIKEEVLRLYFEILKEVFQRNDQKRINDVAATDKEIERVKAQISKLQIRFIEEDLPIQDYNQIKSHLENTERELILKRTHLNMDKSSFAKYCDYGMSMLFDLPTYYQASDVTVKQKIIGSIFPEKLTYDGKKYRTTKTNELLLLLTNNINGFGKVEKKKANVKRQPVQFGSPGWA